VTNKSKQTKLRTQGYVAAARNFSVASINRHSCGFFFCLFSFLFFSSFPKLSLPSLSHLFLFLFFSFFSLPPSAHHISTNYRYLFSTVCIRVYLYILPLCGLLKHRTVPSHIACHGRHILFFSSFFFAHLTLFMFVSFRNIKPHLFFFT